MDNSNITLVVLAGTVIASISQALKIVTLTEKGEAYPRPARFIAHSLSGGLGYYSFAMLMLATWGEVASPQLLLGAAAVVGWIGGNVFLALGRWLQVTFKIPLGIPEPRDD